jgi:hypothetical protein
MHFVISARNPQEGERFFAVCRALVLSFSFQSLANAMQHDQGCPCTNCEMLISSCAARSVKLIPFSVNGATLT